MFLKASHRGVRGGVPRCPCSSRCAGTAVFWGLRKESVGGKSELVGRFKVREDGRAPPPLSPALLPPLPQALMDHRCEENLLCSGQDTHYLLLEVKKVYPAPLVPKIHPGIYRTACLKKVHSFTISFYCRVFKEKAVRR